MCFILSFSCDSLNFFVFSFVFLGNFSHLQMCFLIIFFLVFFFAGVAEGREFLKQCKNFQVCEFSQVVKFRNL